MPHQNRVTPFNELIATPTRGTLTGNRGIEEMLGVEDAQTQTDQDNPQSDSE